MHIQGKRYGKDRTVTIPVVRSCQDINLGFWGWNCVISPEVEFDEIEEMEEEVEMEQLGMSLSDETSSELDMPSRSSINPGRLSSPALSVLSALSSSPPRDTSPLRTSTRATALATHLHLDLPGLIASAIVFHPRSTVGVEEVVKALLREIGGMWDILEGGKTGLVTNQESEQEREELAVDEWWDLVESVLREEEMFGVIENVGLRVSFRFPLRLHFADDPDADHYHALSTGRSRERSPASVLLHARIRYVCFSCRSSRTLRKTCKRRSSCSGRNSILLEKASHQAKVIDFICVIFSAEMVLRGFFFFLFGTLSFALHVTMD